MLNYTEHYRLVIGNPRYIHGRDDVSSLPPPPQTELQIDDSYLPAHYS
jgi:hypothetical protein